MFDWLFPNWNASGIVTLVVAARAFWNVVLALAIRDAAESPRVVAACGALAGASTLLTVVVLRGVTLPLVGTAELLAQLSLPVLALVVARRGDASSRARSAVVLGGAALTMLYLLSIPLLGEATVAP